MNNWSQKSNYIDPFEAIGRADTIKEDGKKPAIDCKEKNPYIGIPKERLILEYRSHLKNFYPNYYLSSNQEWANQQAQLEVEIGQLNHALIESGVNPNLL